MRAILALLIVGAWLVTPCASAERFTSERPSPLKRLKPSQADGNGARFAGSVQLAGQFLIVHHRKNPGLPVWQVTFFPDAASAALLPHPVDEKAVSELDFSNREPAVAMLRDLATVENKLADGGSSLAGAATVTIRSYRTEVLCDHRWYLAELVSVTKGQPLVVSAHAGDRGC